MSVGGGSVDERRPWRDNAFGGRDDARRALLDLFEPLIPAFEAGGARVSLGEGGTSYDRAAAELEAFARPLWGIVPFAAGGGEFGHWDLVRRGLVEGTDPRHPGYWGGLDEVVRRIGRGGQRMVEMAAIGFALALVPEHVFEPLSPNERHNLLTWLAAINRHPPVKNNWQFFRVLVNLGFARVGGPYDRDAVTESLEEIERHWLGDGWYSDGVEPGNVDHYIGWAYHFYGLIYAVHDDTDPARAARFRARARRFAADFETWFDPKGRAIAYGRSLTYRFAAVSLWGALAYAGEEALPWGRIRGLWARNLRWWGEQPITRDGGVLSTGYRYEQSAFADHYNGPGSPYWALKAFLPLALDDGHPFWTAAEERVEPRVSVQRPPIMVVSRDDRQAQLLTGGRGTWFPRHGAAKYGKFAYSSAFGFAVAGDAGTYADVTDSALVLCDADGVCRVRSSSTEAGIEGDVVWSRWSPFPDVEVTTVLYGRAPWHVRVHRIRTGRALATVETGFSLGWDGGDPAAGPPPTRDLAAGTALLRTPVGTSLIADPGLARRPDVRDLQPNTDLVAPRALVPALTADLEPGEHTLVCAVGAVEAPDTLDRAGVPEVPEDVWKVLAALTRD